MKDQILQLLREQDTFAVIDFLSQQRDEVAAADALDAIMRDLYWKQKDLANSLAIGRLAAQFALHSAAKADDPKEAAGLRSRAKAFCYNIASFAWSGWGEEGVKVTASDEAIGLDAARANLRIAQELDKGHLALSRAYWMLGAQQISAKDFSAAIESFRRGAMHAKLAEQEPEVLLNDAFLGLAELMCARSDRECFNRLEISVDALLRAKDGPTLADQVYKALEVFCPEWKLERVANVEFAKL